MTIQNVKARKFAPAGVSDAIDEENGFPGCCLALTNLIPDPTMKNSWVPRPASSQLTNFSGFTTPGQISALRVVGSFAFGLLATGRNAGHDEPFCFNIPGLVFVAVSGVT